MSDCSIYFKPLTESFEEYANKAAASSMKAYLKDLFEFYGIKQAPRRAVFNQFVKQFGLPKYDEVGQYLSWLYDQPQREFHYCAVELLLKFKRNWDDDVINNSQFLIETNSWWDTVDLIATNVVGAYLLKHPNLVEQTINPWIKSSDMWLNRTAIIYQLKYRDDTDIKTLTRSILPHLDSDEFFHQKAIGWALRQYSKYNSDWVIGFVNEHDLKPLSRREALRLIQ